MSRMYDAPAFVSWVDSKQFKFGRVYRPHDGEKYFIWPECTRNEQKNEFTHITKQEDAIPLDDLEHLVFGIKVLEYASTPNNFQDPKAKHFKQDTIDALQVALDANIPIAHLFMAHTLDHFEEHQAREQITKHLNQFKAQPAPDESSSTVTRFNHMFARVGRPLRGISEDRNNDYQTCCDQLYDTLTKKYLFAYIKRLTNVQLTKKLQTLMSPKKPTEQTEETKGEEKNQLQTLDNKAIIGEILSSLAGRLHPNKQSTKPSIKDLKFYVWAAIFDNETAKTYIGNMPNTFPDLQELISGDLQEKITAYPYLKAEKLLSCYLNLYACYQYLHNKNNEWKSKPENKQNIRQCVFREDLITLSQYNATTLNLNQFKDFVTTSGAEKKIISKKTGMGIVSHSSSQTYQNLRLALVSELSPDDFSLLQEAADCFHGTLFTFEQGSTEGAFCKQLMTHTRVLAQTLLEEKNQQATAESNANFQYDEL